MKGKELIEFIQENSLENKNIYIHKVKDDDPEVIEIKESSLFIDELGDLLLTSDDNNIKWSIKTNTTFY